MSTTIGGCPVTALQDRRSFQHEAKHRSNKSKVLRRARCVIPKYLASVPCTPFRLDVRVMTCDVVHSQRGHIQVCAMLVFFIAQVWSERMGRTYAEAFEHSTSAWYHCVQSATT